MTTPPNSPIRQGSAHLNDNLGYTRTPFANLVNPALFPGEYFWVAAGGGLFTDVISSEASANSTTQTYAHRGTSMAAPHIAGLYAVLKAIVPGIPVNDISSWIKNNAADPVSYDLCPGAAPCPATFLAPRLR